MTAVEQLISPLLMLVLSVFSAPQDAKVIMLDVIVKGQIETLHIERTDKGFVLYDTHGDAKKEVGRITPVKDEEGVFNIKFGKEETRIDLSVVDKLDTLLKGEKKSGKLKVGEHESLKFTRSGDVLYLQPNNETIYVVH